MAAAEGAGVAAGVGSRQLGRSSQGRPLATQEEHWLVLGPTLELAMSYLRLWAS